MFLGEAEVRRFLVWKPLFTAMETALIAFSAGRVIQPVRTMLTIEEGKRYAVAKAGLRMTGAVSLSLIVPGFISLGLIHIIEVP